MHCIEISNQIKSNHSIILILPVVHSHKTFIIQHEGNCSSQFHDTLTSLLHMSATLKPADGAIVQHIQCIITLNLFYHNGYCASERLIFSKVVREVRVQIKTRKSLCAPAPRENPMVVRRWMKMINIPEHNTMIIVMATQRLCGLRWKHLFMRFNLFFVYKVNIFKFGGSVKSVWF